MSFSTFLVCGPKSSRFDPFRPNQVFQTFTFKELREDNRTLEEIRLPLSTEEKIKSYGSFGIIEQYMQIDCPKLRISETMWTQFTGDSFITCFKSTLIGIATLVFGAWYAASRRSRPILIATLISTLVTGILSGMALIRSKEASDELCGFYDYKASVADFRAAVIRNRLESFDILKEEYLKFDKFRARAEEFFTQNEKEKLFIGNIRKRIKKKNLTVSHCSELLQSINCSNLKPLETHLQQLNQFLKEKQLPNEKTTREICSSAEQQIHLESSVLKAISCSLQPNQELILLEKQFKSKKFQPFDAARIEQQHKNALRNVEYVFLQGVIQDPNKSCDFLSLYNILLFYFVYQDHFSELLRDCSQSCTENVITQLKNCKGPAEPYIRYLLQFLSQSRNS